MHGSKLLAVGLLILAALGVMIGCISGLAIAKGYAALDGSSSHAYFRICPTNSTNDCTAFGTGQLLAFCLGSFAFSMVFAIFGLKKWRFVPESRT